MDNKELNIAIYKSLAAKAAELFHRTKIAAGTYSAKELADGKKDKKALCWEMENSKEEITISVESFVCRFAAWTVFVILSKFEKLIPAKERVKFTKCEETAGLVCSFTMDVPKSAIDAAKFVSKDIWRDSLTNVCVNIQAGRLEASDGYKLVMRPVAISNFSGELLERRAFIRPNDLKNMVGRCNVCVYEKEDTYRTEVTTERGETCICECGGRFPNFDSVSWQPKEKQAIRFADLKGLKKIAKDAAKSECKLQLITEAGSKSAQIVAYHFEEQCFEYSVPLSEPANYYCIVWIKPEILIPFFGNWTGELFIKSASYAFVLGSQSGYNLLMPVGPNEGKEVKDPEYSIEPAPETDEKISNPSTELQAEQMEPAEETNPESTTVSPIKQAKEYVRLVRNLHRNIESRSNSATFRKNQRKAFALVHSESFRTVVLPVYCSDNNSVIYFYKLNDLAFSDSSPCLSRWAIRLLSENIFGKGGLCGLVASLKKKKLRIDIDSIITEESSTNLAERVELEECKPAPAPTLPEPVPLPNWQIIAAIWLLGLFAIGRRLGMAFLPLSPRINIPSAVHTNVLLSRGEIHIRTPGKDVVICRQTYRHKIRNISDGKFKHIGTYRARGPDIF